MKKILCIHGIGGKDATMDQWSPKWEEAIKNSLEITEELDFRFLKIDYLFDDSKKRIGKIKYLQGIAKFISSWVGVAIDESRGERGFGNTIAAYAGMPAQFVTDQQLRIELYNLLKENINSFKPDLIYAHSLGTLVTYDYLMQETAKGKSIDVALITSGAQIFHPAMRKTFGGKIMPLAVRFWLNLHNENDRVFAKFPIKISAANFKEVDTPFEHEFINHEVLKYMAHDNAIADGWPIIREFFESNKSREFKSNKSKQNAATLTKRVATRKPNRKALLVGINDYPDPSNHLDGCVNDVYRISEVLQEYGFDPEEIRVVVNNRATAKGIRDRMDWLLKDTHEEDLRFFFYSGHGAQMPGSTIDWETDHNDECLVPYDFDWTVENAFTDKEFLNYYSNLEYGVNFIAMLDCCHSGGMTRNGLFKAKGINPPDDIRHREIKWDEKRQMWIPRKLDLSKKDFFNSNDKHSEQFTGKNSATFKFGRAIPLWSDVKEFEKSKKKYGHEGPFVPVLLQACQEGESAWEYRHGVTSFGAFTYCMTTILRELKRSKKNITFNDIVERTTARLKELDYKQEPILFGPGVKKKEKIPFPVH